MGKIFNVIKENWELIFPIITSIALLIMVVISLNDPGVINWLNKSLLNMSISDICMLLLINSILMTKKPFFKLKIESTPEKDDKKDNQIL